MNSYFRCEPPVTTIEVADGELLDIIRERAEGVRPDKPVDEKSYSRWSLGELLKDGGRVRILKVDDALRRRLTELVEQLRGDLDLDDWAAVIRILKEGRQADLWMYEDADRYKVPVFFKSDVRMTEGEIARFQRDVLDDAIRKYAEKLRKEEKKK